MRTEKFNPQFVIRNLKFVIVLSAADKMHDFDFIRVFDDNIFPVFFSHDHFVYFNRNSFRRQRKIFEQFAEINFSLNFLFFAVNRNCHKSNSRQITSAISLVERCAAVLFLRLHSLPAPKLPRVQF